MGQDGRSRVFDRGRALVVGVARYGREPALPPAVTQDAQDIADVLCAPEHAGYPENQVKLLLDGEATRHAVLDALADIAAVSTPDDTVVVYFSGHGRRGGPACEDVTFLLTHEADPARLGETSIAAEELTAALADIQAARVVVFLDACHAGSAADPKGAGAFGEVGLPERDLAALASGAGRVVMASCQPDERSWIQPGERNSLFTKHLLAALQGGAPARDGLIGIFGLCDHVAACVRAERPDQRPWIKMHAVEGDFPIALHPGRTDAEPGAALTDVRPPPDRDDAWWSEFRALASSLYPHGPMEDEFWARAGGDVSRLPKRDNGRAAWHAALRLVRNGGGGTTLDALLAEMRLDYPTNAPLSALAGPAA